MKIRPFVAVCAAVALTVSTHAHASMHLPLPVHNLFTKSKIVNFNLRNDTGSPLELKVGETVMTVPAGTTIAMKQPVGTRILANAATSRHQAGELLTQVSSQFNEATVGVH